MRILNFEELNIQKHSIIEEIIKGSIFIYPTDTIYGIGCNAELSDSVKKIRKIKERPQNPFSVIAPSLEWINKNCIVKQQGKKWLGRLPGPYTLIFKLKNPDCVTKDCNPGLDTLGIRIPYHWISNLVKEAGIPIITTSVNLSKEDYMSSLENLDPKIRRVTDFILYEGEKEVKPSKIVDLTRNVRIIDR